MAKKNLDGTTQTQTPPGLPLTGDEQGKAGSVPVAYHAGPPEINFFGRAWQRDIAQSVTQDEWAAMQARGDFNEFNFSEEQ